MILPGSQLGVLGGGQLGMFFTAAAQRMGYRVVVWDPDSSAPARVGADLFIHADFDDPSALHAFLRGTQAVTYEWENIPAVLVEGIEKEVITSPGSRVLRLLQNRISQKEFLKEREMPVVPFCAFHDPTHLPRSVAALGLPCVVKTATSGYDGQGQWHLNQPSEVLALTELFLNHPHATGWIVEKRVSYLKELSVVVAQGEGREIKAYPVAENWHETGILRMSQVPADITSPLCLRVSSVATEAVKALGDSGVFCVEMFLLNYGEVLINEIAPRPHNSGHYTMDVCAVSQFEQQVRALCGLPLIAPRLLSSAVLINLLGSEISQLDSREGVGQLLTLQGARIYHYRKSAIRTGRKMGHLLLVDAEPKKAMEQAKVALRSLRAG